MAVILLDFPENNVLCVRKTSQNSVFTKITSPVSAKKVSERNPLNNTQKRMDFAFYPCVFVSYLFAILLFFEWIFPFSQQYRNYLGFALRFFYL